MKPFRCPGQDSRYLKPQEITEVQCEKCGRTVELWPDELARRCPGCGRRVSNPRLNLKCLEWCAKADECLEQIRAAGVSVEEAREFMNKKRERREQAGEKERDDGDQKNHPDR